MTDTVKYKNNIAGYLVEGKSFEDILPDVKNMVYYYVRLYYKKWNTIMDANLYSIDDIAQDMFVSLCNKKDKKGLSNLEKRFIMASEENLGMKYIRNTIGKTVALNMTSLARVFNRKPKPVSVEELSAKYAISSSHPDDFIDHMEILEDKSENIDLKLAYKLFIESIEDKVFKDYYTIDDSGKFKMLSVHKVLDMISDKLTISEMTKFVYIKKDNVNISYKRMNEIVKDVRAIAKNSYNEGNCLIDLNFKEN